MTTSEPDGAAPPAPDGPAAPERALRLRRAQRDQVTPVPLYLDALLPDDHLARLIWAAVQRLDLTDFTRALVVVEGGPGRGAADPAVLVALWVYATSQGVVHARKLARLCTEHLAYIWLCGGVSVNYHSLSDVRVRHADALEAVFTQIVGGLWHTGLIEFEHVAQDGMRVRASAGAASFRRKPTLEQSLSEAQTCLEAVLRQAAEPDAGSGAAPAASRRQRAARERAARERVARLEAALAELPAVEAAKRAAKPKQAAKDTHLRLTTEPSPTPTAPPARAPGQARVSTTDPEARVMKMADGGFRPAYNVELAADTAHQALVGYDVTNVGSDQAQAPPMVQQVQQRCAGLPDTWLMDGGFASRASIQQLEAQGLTVLAPVQTPKDPTRDPFQPRPDDAPEVAAWRQRMGTEAAKTDYRLRAATIECINAQARCRFGLQHLPVRGLAKVRCLVGWLALTHNLLLWLQALVTSDGQRLRQAA